MGTGKKLAKAKMEMSMLKLEAVKELKAASEREQKWAAGVGWYHSRANFRAILAVLALLCWVVTYFVMR